MKNTIKSADIGQRIKTLRNNKKITQEKLAELTKLSLAHISNLENGHSKMSIESLIAISDALCVPTDAILFGEISHSDEPYYKEFVDIMIDCTNHEKDLLLSNALYMKKLIQNIKKEE